MTATHLFTTRMLRMLRAGLAAGLVLGAATCGGSQGGVIGPAPDELAVGTWGGENAGVIVDGTNAHVHIACTRGDFAAPIAMDEEGRFSVSGSYVLRAFPVQIGPSLPAQFAGVVEGNRLTLTVAVNDTVEKQIVALGPVTVRFDRTPRMQVCPICRTPDDKNVNGIGWPTVSSRRSVND